MQEQERIMERGVIHAFLKVFVRHQDTRYTLRILYFAGQRFVRAWLGGKGSQVQILSSRQNEGSHDLG